MTLSLVSCVREKITYQNGFTRLKRIFYDF